jgi:polyisoprenoid-binding protein YceI
VAGAAGIWYFFGGSAPAAADLDEAAGAISTTETPTPADVDDTWTVDTSIGDFSPYTSSWAGFRVAEVLDNIGDSEAVGTTPQVTGTLTLDGDALSAARIEVELTSIRSDRERRDPAIQRTLETSQFPTATFELAEPIDLPSTPAEGVTYNLSATGNLTSMA